MTPGRIAHPTRPSLRQPSREPVHDVRKDGWTNCAGVLSEQDLAPLRAEIETVVATHAPDIDPWGPISRRVPDEARTQIYRCLRYLPGLMRLATHDAVMQLISDLGIRQPAIMQSHNVRMDGPGDDHHLFHWHQDFTYLLGSPNAVTLWIPLSGADARRGSVQIIPASHRQGVLAVEPTSTRHTRSDTALAPQDLVMATPPSEDAGFTVTADPGDIVAFSMLTVHRSTPNLSDQIRWTAQLRFADLASPGFQEAGCPFGDTTNIYHAGYRGSFYDPSR